MASPEVNALQRLPFLLDLWLEVVKVRPLKFEKIEILLLELVDPPSDPLRKLINPEFVRELAESIRENGLLEPVKVRPVNGRYEIVFGHRRYLAHRMIGADKIRAIVKEMSDEEVIVARAVENIQREDLLPLEMAELFGKLRASMGLTPNKIAQKMGKALSTVQKYLKLLEMEPDFQRAVNIGKLSLGAALELYRVDDEKMRRYYFTAAVDNGITEQVAQSWVADYEKTKAAKYYDEAGSVGVTVGSSEPNAIWHTCFGCQGPVEVRQVRMVGLCPDCIKEFERR